MISSLRHFSASYVPRSQIVIVPAPYWPLGISPWNSRYSSGWSSVRTARWLCLGSSGMPLGTAHEASTPSCSSRRSQCRRVAWCSWTTNWPDATGAGAVSPSRPASPAGSAVVAKSRLARYSASRSRAMPANGPGRGSGGSPGRRRPSLGPRPIRRRAPGTSRIGTWVQAPPCGVRNPSDSRPGPLTVGRDARALARVIPALARVTRDLCHVELVGLAVDGLVGLLGEAVVLLAHVDLDLGFGRAVLGVLDELLLGHLPALGVAATCFVDRVEGRVVWEVLLEVAGRSAADPARLRGRRPGLLLGEGVVLVGHLATPGFSLSA